MILCCFAPLSCGPFSSFVLLYLSLLLGILHIDYSIGHGTIYAAILKNCGWSHHKTPLTATTLNGMVLYCKTANGRTTRVPSLPLL